MVSRPLKIDELRRIIIDQTKKLDKDDYANKCITQNEIYKASYKTTRISEKSKAEGTELLKQKSLNFSQLYNILTLFNESIAFAPNGSEELAGAYAQKSAVLLRMKKYKESIVEIDKALKITKSKILKIILLCRKAKCHTALGSSENGIYLEEAKFIMTTVENSKKVKFGLNGLIEKIQSVIDENKIDMQQEERRRTQALSMMEEAEKTDVWKSIQVEYSEKYGRHLKAARDFQPGEIILVEKPYFNNLDDFRANQYCDHCFYHLWTAVPCDHCCRRLYCSEECKTQSWNECHELECSLLSKMRITFDSEINCLTLLVMGVFCKALKEAGSIEQLLADSESPNQCKGTSAESILSSQNFTNYKSIFTLPVSQPDEDSVKQSTKRSIAQLVSLAKYTKILGKTYDFTDMRKLLKDDTAILIGALLLKFNLILSDSTLWVDLVDPNNRKSTIKGEIETELDTCLKRLNRCLPMMSLHTLSGCVPNVQTFSAHGNKFVICAIRPIKAGEQLVSHAKSKSIWHMETKLERQSSYIKKYGCPCDCQACTEDWSKFLNDEREFMRMGTEEMQCPEMMELWNELGPIFTNWQSNCLKPSFPEIEIVSQAINLVSSAWSHQQLTMPSPIMHRSVLLLMNILEIFYDPSEIYAKVPRLRPSLTEGVAVTKLSSRKKM